MLWMGDDNSCEQYIAAHTAGIHAAGLLRIRFQTHTAVALMCFTEESRYYMRYTYRKHRIGQYKRDYVPETTQGVSIVALTKIYGHAWMQLIDVDHHVRVFKEVASSVDKVS